MFCYHICILCTICYEQLFSVSNFIFCSLSAINDSQCALHRASLLYISCAWGMCRVHLLETAKSQRSDTNISVSITWGKTPHGHHITKVWEGLVTRDSKISDLHLICNVYCSLSFLVAPIVGTSSFHFAQPELSSSSASWTRHVHPEALEFLCSPDLSEHQSK